MTKSNITTQRQNDHLTVTIPQGVQFTIVLGSRLIVRILTVFLSLFRDLDGKKIVTQQQIGDLLGFSRQTTNYTIQDYKQGGFEQVIENKEWDLQVFTSKVRQYLKDLWCANPFLQAKEVIMCLKERFPHLQSHKITPSQIRYHIDQAVRFSECQKVLRKRFKQIAPGRLEYDLGPILSDLTAVETNGHQKRKSMIWLSHLLKPETWLGGIREQKQAWLTRFEHYKVDVQRMYLGVVLFYFQTNCAIRTVADYFELSPSKVVRIIRHVGNLESTINQWIGHNTDVRTIGIDEKWIKIKTNEEKWSYLFLAVDADSHDILYLDVFEKRDEASITTFLLGLKQLGYQPEFIVTDLLKGYTRLLPKVFGKRIKHVHCLFHFLQNLYKHFQNVYGLYFKEKNPQALALYRQLKAIFRCTSAKTARTRYFDAMSLQERYPEARAIWNYLGRHFRHMMYPLEYKGVPRTNNCTERVIKRLCRQIKNSNGFENQSSARVYFKAFQIAYRLTPFRQDNKNKTIRGKLPIEVSLEPFTKKSNRCQKGIQIPQIHSGGLTM